MSPKLNLPLWIMFRKGRDVSFRKAKMMMASNWNLINSKKHKTNSNSNNENWRTTTRLRSKRRESLLKKCNSNNY